MNNPYTPKVRTARLLISFLFLLALSPVQSQPAAAKIRVTEIRHWSNPNYTRVVIDLDRKAHYTYKLLKQDPSINKPRRLYVDISGAVLGEEIQKSIHINDGLLKKARAGQYDRKTVRVVLDIESLDDYKIFPLSDPFRIVIDVSGKGGNGGKGKGQPPEAVRPSAAPAGPRATRPLTIVIDPGHGGKDPGAIGRRGLREKDVTLKISRMLRDQLSKRTKAKILMTRTRDVYIPLEERTAIANSREADLFISIHINASPRRAASGIETYTLNIAADDDSRRVAVRENAISRKALSDLEFILNDLIKTTKTNDSVLLATSVHSRLVAKLRKKYRGVKSNGVKGAPFYVLVGTRMPSILIEVSFISNSREEKRLKSPKYLKEVVEGISNGIMEYINGQV
jgi:N-acetylmuramoyl-L-alanine amidase